MRGLPILCAVVLAGGLAGCSLGGRGGGGPSAEPRPVRPPYKAPAVSASAVERGKVHFRVLGCALCHGKAGMGGVANLNSETGGVINGLTKVREGYSSEELARLIRRGVPKVGKKNPRGPTPPLRMPGFASFLTPHQTKDLVTYLFGLFPRAAKAASESWDEKDEPAAGKKKPAQTQAPADDWDEKDEPAAGKKKPAQTQAPADDWDKDEPVATRRKPAKARAPAATKRKPARTHGPAATKRKPARTHAPAAVETKPAKAKAPADDWDKGDGE